MTGGGTGGHIFPLITVAQKIREKDSTTELLFIGPQGQLEKYLMENNNIPQKNILTGKFRRYFSLSNPVDIIKIFLGIFQALWYLLIYMPDAIFSKGGYASIPVIVAGWLYRIPILTHESDSVPGMVNSILGKLATRVAVSYPQAEKSFVSYQTLLTGNPLREDINKGDPQKAREKFSLIPDKKVIFAWGGSLGAEIINSKLINILPELLSEYQVIHQTGEKNFEKVKERVGEMGVKIGRDGYHPLPFIGDELKDVLAVADLIISRAGANSLSEIAANKKPSIIIPLKNSANDHQRMNAYAISQLGGCFVLEEDNLGENLLLSRINEIMKNEELRNKLSQNIYKFFQPDAAEKIVEGIFDMLKDKAPVETANV